MSPIGSGLLLLSIGHAVAHTRELCDLAADNAQSLELA